MRDKHKVHKVRVQRCEWRSGCTGPDAAIILSRQPIPNAWNINHGILSRHCPPRAPGRRNLAGATEPMPARNISIPTGMHTWWVVDLYQVPLPLYRVTRSYSLVSTLYTLTTSSPDSLYQTHQTHTRALRIRIHSTHQPMQTVSQPCPPPGHGEQTRPRWPSNPSGGHPTPWTEMHKECQRAPR